jgi:hypothetical protein
MTSITDIRDSLYTCAQSEHLLRTISIALVVGTWLTVSNQGDVLMTSRINAVMIGKIAVNYLTPFVVSNFGLLSREESEEADL